MHHIFIVKHEDKSKYVHVEGTHEYALSYISGYVQALRDKFGNGGKITVLKASDDVVMNHN